MPVLYIGYRQLTSMDKTINATLYLVVHNCWPDDQYFSLGETKATNNTRIGQRMIVVEKGPRTKVARALCMY